MRFEEVLPNMREGKKAKLPNYSEDRCWIVCEARMDLLTPDSWLSLACIDSEGKAREDSRTWGIPRWAIMSEDWEIVDD